MLTPRSYSLNTSQKQSFLKPFLTIDEQLAQLKSRGMKFNDEKEAKHYLEHLNYYRLGGYWLLFESDHETHTFKENVYFEEVLNLYIFDRELRLLILDIIERIEVSIRSKFAHHLAKCFGSHAHLTPELFYSSDYYYKTLSNLKSEIDRNKNELFIKHHFDKYNEELPPIWVCVEVMSIGQISNWYSNLKERKHRQAIAKDYGLDEKILSSFLHHLTTVRNVAAHHSRLWNRKFTIDFVLPNHPSELNQKFNQISKKYIYNTLIMCEYLMSTINKDSMWKSRLEELINSHKIDTTRMGYKSI